MLFDIVSLSWNCLTLFICKSIFLYGSPEKLYKLYVVKIGENEKRLSSLISHSTATKYSKNNFKFI